MRNVPGENFHTIKVAPFSGTKLSLEADMLLSLSDVGFVLLCMLEIINADAELMKPSG